MISRQPAVVTTLLLLLLASLITGLVAPPKRSGPKPVQCLWSRSSTGNEDDVTTWKGTEQYDKTQEQLSRRRILIAGFLAATTTANHMVRGVSLVLPAHAVKPRNEALCNTGLFENFQEYRCTPLGNIEDEGKSKALSSQEEAAADSLLSKLGSFATETTTTSSGVSETSKKLPSGKEATMDKTASQ